MSSKQEEILATLDHERDKIQHLCDTSMLLPVFFELDKYVSKLNRPKSVGTLSFHSSGSKPTGLPLKEIISLIKDGLNGRLNQYIQEIIKEAEFSIEIKPQNPMDSKGRNELNLSLKVAATAVDKYAGLLSMILEQKDLNMSSVEKDIKTGMTNINVATRRLKRVEVLQALFLVNIQCLDHIERHYEPSCCSLFFSSLARPPQTSKQYELIKIWLEDLVHQQVTLEELMGAIYSIRRQIEVIHKPLEKYALRDTLDRLIKNQGFPVFTDDSVNDYLLAFEKRATTLHLDMPSHFEVKRQIEMISLV